MWKWKGVIRKLSLLITLILLLVIINPLACNSGNNLFKNELYNLKSSDTPIGFGETITDSIVEAGGSVNYTISGSIGDTILIRMREVSGTSFYPEIGLYSPSGIELISTGYSVNFAELSYNLPQNGDYKIKASDYYGSGLGTYNIYVQRVNNPENATAINFGINYFGSIDLLGRADTYTFLANAGDVLLIRMGTVSGVNFGNDLRLYSPTGTELSSDTTEIYYALPQNGKYTLLAHDFEGDTGSYYLSTQRINNPNNSKSVDLGKTISAGVAIPGGMNTFTFSALASDTVLIRMKEISGTSFYPEIRLYSPSGTELISTGYSVDFAELSYNLPQNGDYTIIAVDYYDSGLGTYNLYVQRVNNPENATAINFGLSYFGSIDLLGRADTYTFLANTGDVVLIRMGKVSGVDFGNDLRLYSPTGTELSSASAELVYNLPQNGKYTVLASDDEGDIGSYYIYAQRLNNPSNYKFVDFGAIGTSLFDAIEYSGEADTFLFNGNIGDEVYISITEISGASFYPEIRLYSPSGTELISTGYSVDFAEITYNLPENGDYSVLVMDYYKSGSGSYESFFQWLSKSDNLIIKLPVPYIHQCWDTPNDFDGSWACGASSAVMILAYYGIIAPWPCECTMPYTHTSNYGNYICKEYTHGTYTFSDMTLDASENPAYGAYGYIHHSDGLAKLGRMIDYFEIHGLESWEVYSPSESEIRAELDSGHPVPASTKLTDLGHWVVVLGYTEDGSYVVHDPFGSKPYGSGPCGNYNGSNVIYTWDDMKIDEKWVAIVHPTEEAYLFVEIIDQFFSTEGFDIKFLIYDDDGTKIDFANINVWWNGDDVSSNVQNLGGGIYFITLNPITIASGEAPILLEMLISAVGYQNKYFDTNIAVDPDSIDKGKSDNDGFPGFIVPGYNLYFLIIVICLFSIYFYSKRKVY